MKRHRIGTFCALTAVLALAPAAARAATPIYGQDQIITSASGARYYVTAYDGQARPLTTFNPADVPPGLTKLVPLPIPTTPGLPSRVMLDEEGFITPVDDQQGRTSCTIFSSVGAIESEYLRQYGLSLDLSEEYVINMMNEGRPPNWTGGSIGEKLYTAAYYGVPPATDWPYLGTDQDVIDLFDPVLGITPGSSAEATMLQNIWHEPLQLDLVNYAPAVYPPLKAHQDAIYGPTVSGIAKVALNGSDPTPLETLLAEGHPIVFGTATGEWKQDPTTGVFSYANNGTGNDHAILLVGYDHAKQLFRIKNSWGAGWNNGGFADFTYDLVMKTIADPYYITALRSPTAGNVGNGALRGWWRGILGGQRGVAVIHHAFTSTGMTGVVTNDAGYFYTDGGSTYPLEWSMGNENMVMLQAVGSPEIQSLTLSRSSSGWTYSGTGGSGNLDYSATGNWCRVLPAPGTPTITPASYPAAVADPYAFPTGACAPTEKVTTTIVVVTCRGTRCI